jgi:hypothetical protein
MNRKQRETAYNNIYESLGERYPLHYISFYIEHTEARIEDYGHDPLEDQEWGDFEIWLEWLEESRKVFLP